MFHVHVKRNFMHRESFLILYLIFLINEEKGLEKILTNTNEKVLMFCADEVLTHLKLMVNNLDSNVFW